LRQKVNQTEEMKRKSEMRRYTWYNEQAKNDQFNQMYTRGAQEFEQQFLKQEVGWKHPESWPFREEDKSVKRYGKNHIFSKTSITSGERAKQQEKAFQEGFMDSYECFRPHNFDKNLRTREHDKEKVPFNSKKTELQRIEE